MSSPTVVPSTYNGEMPSPALFADPSLLALTLAQAAGEIDQAVPVDQREGKANVLVVLLLLILLVGVILLAIVLLMGSHAKRISREPVEPTVHDPYQTLRSESARATREQTGDAIEIDPALPEDERPTQG